MKNIKAGIIGFGGIGVLHADWMQNTGRIEVVAVAECNESLRAKVKEKLPLANFYHQVSDLLKHEKLDLVVVASPHDLHAPLAIECLNAGVNVMVEKPMATTYADCQAMITAARTSRKMLTVFHNRRLDSWFLAAKEAIASGRLGPLVELQSSWHNRPAWKDHISWRSYHRQSGGLLFDWGAHLVDHLLHFEPSPVLSVSGFQYRFATTPPDQNEDQAEVEIRFASGSLGRFTISAADRHPATRYVLVGEKATLVDDWNWNGGSAKVYTGSGEKEFLVEDLPYEKEGVNIPTFYHNLADHLQTGEPLIASAESAARIIQVLEAAQISHARGGVPIPFATPEM